MVWYWFEINFLVGMSIKLGFFILLILSFVECNIIGIFECIVCLNYDVLIEVF